MKNVVYIFCDELRQDALGCYGNPAGPMKTPNIDSIARRGILFENCFCNSPVCVPSRASLLTGLYPEDTAVYHNEAAFPTFELPRAVTTFPEVLAQAGYRTANFGKTHLPAQMRPFQLDDQDGSKMNMGLTAEEYGAMPAGILEQRKRVAADRYRAAGADLVIDSIRDLPAAIETLNERLRKEGNL